MRRWPWPVWQPRTDCRAARLTGPSLPAAAWTPRRKRKRMPILPAPPFGNWCRIPPMAPIFPPAPSRASSASSRNLKAARPSSAMS
ncbi:hypothetical protein G6F50_014921 [Rhizopus delemar]|uniref:Uncharacterized protein n=1 Tax=Rhizopus delemar TaxID=936053 RepID=A0A9P6Y160_9FUNG|nr:hypothetical protein G6F50_014921 [Rhizopus delemar]